MQSPAQGMDMSRMCCPSQKPIYKAPTFCIDAGTPHVHHADAGVLRGAEREHRQTSQVIGVEERLGVSVHKVSQDIRQSAHPVTISNCILHLSQNKTMTQTGVELGTDIQGTFKGFGEDLTVLEISGNSENQRNFLRG